MSSKPGQTEESFVIEKQADCSGVDCLWLVVKQPAMYDLGGGVSDMRTSALAFLLPPFVLTLARSDWK